MGTAKVYAGSMAGEQTGNLSGEVQISANSPAGISMEAESSEEVKTHGGEEIDAFINAFCGEKRIMRKRI